MSQAYKDKRRKVYTKNGVKLVKPKKDKPMTQQSTDVTLELDHAIWYVGDLITASIEDPNKAFFMTSQFMEVLEAAKAHRASLSKSVGEVMSAKDFAISWCGYASLIPEFTKAIKARDAAIAQLAQPPEGYVLVPIEPTEAMKDAGYNAGSPRFSEPSPPEIYRAMIAASKGGKDV